MDKFKYTEVTGEIGYVNPAEILSFVSEEEIYALVLGYEPKEYEYIKAPYRDDDEAGCWFEYGLEDKLWFRDFAYGNRPLDCFEMVKVYYNLPNFYETLKFVKRKLIDKVGSETTLKKRVPIKRDPKIKGVSIKILTRPFDIRDKNYWQAYGISKQNLIEDKIFPIQRIKLIYEDPKKEDKSFVKTSISYAYTEFKNGRKKVYSPFEKKEFKFITNCIQNDIGCFDSLPPFGRQLVITKSHKDCRVLRNLGLNSCWFQNEGQIPSYQQLQDLCLRFKNIIIFFDNDKTGISAAASLQEILERLTKNVRSEHVPIELLKRKITDPSDMYKSVGKKHLIDFLKLKKIL